MYTSTQRNTYKNKGTGPVKYIQDEKVVIMFADYNKFGESARILAGRIKFEMSWQLQLVSFFKKKKSNAYQVVSG